MRSVASMLVAATRDPGPTVATDSRGRTRPVFIQLEDSMLKEFREFAVKGNVLDMAVGIIIGAAFGTVVQSLVNDVIMPPVGLLLGGTDFSEIAIRVGTSPEGEAVNIGVGLFINSVIAFLIVAFAVFMVVRAFNRMKRAEEAAPPAPPAPSAEEKLLTEIRDLLRAQS
jgi:large conductance mechanosensitive channel